MLKGRLAALAVVLAVTGGMSTACSSNKRWCEHDATDTRVSDSYCKRNVPGYEWEYGSKSKNKHKVKKNNHHKVHKGH